MNLNPTITSEKFQDGTAEVQSDRILIETQFGIVEVIVSSAGIGIAFDGEVVYET